MPNFDYKALDIKTKENRTGIIMAATEMEARQKLRELNLVPLSLKAVVNEAGGSNVSGSFNFSKLMKVFTSVKNSDVIAFSRNLAIMVRGGIPLTEALLYFENFAENPKFKKILNSVRSDILSGDNLSNSLAKFPDAFSEIFINITKAGETSGELDVTMDRMADLIGRQEKIKAKVISAAIYPSIVLSIVFIVLIVIFIWVLPAFTKIYKQMGIKLPDLTLFMVFISNCFINQWYIVFPAMFGGMFGFLKFIKTPVGKELFDKFCIRVPVLSQVIRFSNLSQFISTLAVCFNSGVPITEALDFAVNTVGNNELKKCMQSVNRQVQVGKRLGVALSETGIIPELVLLVIATGEESGNLEQSLTTATEYLEKEINGRIEVLMAFMEPLLLLYLGVVVGFVALSIYMPLFSMYENMGK
jgi:type II secretory pathway component PulF